MVAVVVVVVMDGGERDVLTQLSLYVYYFV